MKTLGDKIRYFRNLKGWSQEDIADKLGISLPAYSKIERNITDVNYSRLCQLAKLFGISVIELLSISNKGAIQSDTQKIIAEKEQEIIKLQRKIIELLEKKK